MEWRSWLSFKLLCFVGALLPAAVYGAPTSLNYQGRIVQSDGRPLEHQSVAFEFTLTSPNGVCVLFKEQVSGIDMRNSNGMFDAVIGQGTQVFPTDPGMNLITAFDNSKLLTCLGGQTYMPTHDDIRKLRVQFWDGVGWKLITPDSVIRSVPYAGHAHRAMTAGTAEKLGTYAPTDFVLKSALPIAGCATGESLTWTLAGFSCVSAGAAPSMAWADITGKPTTYSAGGTAGGDLSGTFPNPNVIKIRGQNISSTAPSNGQMLIYKTGTTSWEPAHFGLESLKNSSGTSQFSISSCSDGETLKWDALSGQWICGFDNIGSLAASGVTAGTYRSVTVDTFGRVTSGTNPTTLSGYGITLASAQIIIGSATSVPTSLALSGDATLSNAGVLTVTGIQSKPVSATAPTTNQVLKFNGTQWAPDNDINSGGTVTSVTGTAPVSVATGTSTPVISLANSGVTAGTYRSVTVDVLGRVTSATNPTTLSGYGISLNSAQIFVGDASNVATARTISGDFSVSNTGVATVVSLQSRGVAATAPNNNQILKWNGTAWTPSPDADSGGTVTNVTGSAPIVVATGTSTPAISLATGGVSAAHLATALQDGLWTVSGANVYRPANTLVGIGVSSPRASLDVDGAIVSNATTDNTTATTINFSTGNIQWTSSNCKAFALHNLKDGGAYTFVVKGATSATCSFTAFSGAGSGSLTVHMPIDHGATFASKNTLYNLVVAGADVYIAWTPGY